ncbi:MAG TPA: type II secretion system F family protein [Vicinamibacterales bacterium]|nr:type II secretion system F family protein [Vicinamibacterales bacterium]
MEYRCRLGAPTGQILEEVHVSDSESALRHELEQKGFCVLAMRPKGALGRVALPIRARRRVPMREFLVFNQELATLLKAGMPLVQSLDILRSRVDHPVFRPVLDEVHEKVRAGGGLSDAFASHGALFPPAYSASLLAGEKSGSLDGVLRRYVAYMKVAAGVKRRTLSALVYPAVLVGLAVVVVSIIVFKVYPEFTAFYESFDAELPLVTRVIVAATSFIRAHALLIAGALVLAAGAAWSWLRQPEQRARFDRAVLRVPWVGSAVRRFATSQLARTLATLLGGGMPLVNAIEIGSRSMGNRFLARQMQVAGLRVREGEGFAAAVAASGAFPSVFVKMAEVGESTGALQEMMTSVADFYDEEVEAELGRFVSLVEPTLLIVMGLVIASLLLALYMPLFQLTSVVGTP